METYLAEQQFGHSYTFGLFASNDNLTDRNLETCLISVLGPHYHKV